LGFTSNRSASVPANHILAVRLPGSLTMTKQAVTKRIQATIVMELYHQKDMTTVASNWHTMAKNVAYSQGIKRRNKRTWATKDIIQTVGGMAVREARRWPYSWSA